VEKTNQTTREKQQKQQEQQPSRLIKNLLLIDSSSSKHLLRQQQQQATYISLIFIVSFNLKKTAAAMKSSDKILHIRYIYILIFPLFITPLYHHLRWKPSLPFAV
jgi:membrane protein YdbS with pleckstrin-like domain